MSRYTIFVVIFLAVASPAPAFAQKVPGLWERLQAPGEHDNKTEQKDEEIARLKELVQQQNKKISLLEEKVRLLETELRKSKEATK